MRKLALLLCLCAAAQAQKGTVSTNFTTWNGLTREYLVYVPPALQPNPAMIVVLHGTTITTESNPPTEVFHYMGWDQLADANGFLVVQPIATWKPVGKSGEFFWEAFGTDNPGHSYFPVLPDDSGFLAALTTQLEAEYSVDPKRVFAMGFSSGGMMTQRLCIEHADLFAACAPFSGTIFVSIPPNPFPQPSQPVSIIEFHGDADPTIVYCGGKWYGWGEGLIPSPSIDVDLNYWLAADSLPANSAPMCVNGLPSAPGFDSGPAKVEVQIVREFGFVHTYKQGEIAMAWAFFSTHGR